MAQSWILLIAAAALASAALFWVLRAYRRAGDGAKPAPVLIACALVAVGALGLYAAIGRPGLRDAPFAQRLAALRHRDPMTYTPDEALAVLDQAAKANPSDPTPHIFTGQILLERGQPEAAARAFDAALRRDPRSIEAMLGLGRALVRTDDGRVSADALRLFQTAGAASRDPTPWVYQAMAAMQAGQDAKHFWAEALARMPGDDPRRAMAQRMSRGS